MNTNSTYTISNTQKGIDVKVNITFAEAKAFVFRKMSANKFDNTCLADYQITDLSNGEYLPLQHVSF
jgi:hypothetical protein